MENISISQLLGNRLRFIQLVSVAVLLALAMSLVGSALAVYFEESPGTLLLFGLVLLVLGVIVVIRINVLARAERIEVNGVLVVDAETKVPVKIEEYRFGTEFARNFDALTAENKAIHENWRRGSIGVHFGGHILHSRSDNSYCHELIREGIEYILLDKLSTHLTDYFNREGASKADRIEVLERADVPEILLRNRFLETFSKPTAEREPFVRDKPSEPAKLELPEGLKLVESAVVWSSGRNGAIFSRFQLALPKGSSITRTDANTIRISTKRFDFEIYICFDGYGAHTAGDFEEKYLGRDMMSVHNYEFKIQLSVKYRSNSLFSTKGWEDFRWLDSYFDSVENYFSFSRFLEKISWEKNSALIDMLRIENQKN